MPNKYSHAIVLSNYGSHGLIDYSGSRPPKPASSSSSTTSFPSSARPKAQSSPHSYHSTSRGPTERLRLWSPTPTETKPRPPPLHRKSSSIETQIYAPLHSPTPPPTRDPHSLQPKGHNSEAKTPSQEISERNDSPSNKIQAYNAYNRYAPHGSYSSLPTKRHEEAVHTSSQDPTIQRRIPCEPEGEGRGRSSPEVRDIASQHLPSAEKQPNWRCSSAVLIGGQVHASSDTIRASATRGENESHSLKGSEQPLRIPPNQYGRTSFAAQPFAPERPPSPPATPESDKSFSLNTPIGKPDPITSPPPVPERSARRSLPGPSPKLHSLESSKLKVRIEPSTPKTSSALSTPKSPKGTTFPIATRTSSFNAASTPPPNFKPSSMPSEPCFDDDDTKPESFPGIFDMSSQLFAVDDADLASLPSTCVPDSPDFNVQPWSDDNAGPAIFRNGELNSRRPSTVETVSTRASSFDSAAPPPISMSKRVPPVYTDIISSNAPRVPKSHQKSKPSLASLAFFRSGPKAVLYSQTRPRTPPVPISVSRTAIPSIPALFPCYKGPFPPPERTGACSSRVSRDMNRPNKTRGRSVPPKASDRRKSWFRADPLERPFGLCQQASEGEREWIERNIQSVELL